MSTQQSAGWFSGRTKYITIASILAVGAAGSVAVAANIGILDAAGDNGIGTLSAAGDLVPADTQVVDVYLDPQTSATTTVTTAPPTSGAQEFTVDAAGTATVSMVDGGIHLDRATPSAGWTWSLAQPSPTELTVSFTNGVRTLEFVAGIGPDGAVTANVNEPVLAATPANSPTGGDDEGGHEGGGEDD